MIDLIPTYLLPSTSTMGAVGLWLGLLFSLSIFSILLRDNFLARLSQYIFVGASLGYLAVLVVQHILQPRLFMPLFQPQLSNSTNGIDIERWFLFISGVILVVAALDRTIVQNANAPITQQTGTRSPLRRVLYFLGRFPVLFLLGMGLAVTITGTVQGTFVPLFWHTADTSFEWFAPIDQLALGVFTLLVTLSALLYLFTDPERHLSQLPAPLPALSRAGVWLGQRMLWLAAGVVFARLAAGRFSLLIARGEFFVYSLEQTGIWQWAESIWQQISGL
ncbi:MAG: hypothetical protein AAF639_16635 [Chloroflexota bacterium]